MRLLVTTILLAVSFSAFAENTESVLVSDDNVHYYYESRADIKATDQELAKIISVDYRNARDEFTRHDLLQKITPVLKKRLAEAKTNDKIHLRVGSKLGDYDFDKKAFPIGFGKGTFIPFKNGYVVTFENSDGLEYIPVPLDKARELSQALQRGRQITLEIDGTPVSAMEKQLNWGHHKALSIKVTKLSVTLTRGGKKIGEKDL